MDLSVNVHISSSPSEGLERYWHVLHGFQIVSSPVPYYPFPAQDEKVKRNEKKRVTIVLKFSPYWYDFDFDFPIDNGFDTCFLNCSPLIGKTIDKLNTFAIRFQITPPPPHRQSPTISAKFIFAFVFIFAIRIANEIGFFVTTRITD